MRSRSNADGPPLARTGDHEARDVLARDLRNAASASTSTSASAGAVAQPKRSWQRDFAEQQAALSRSPPTAAAPPGGTVLSTGFPTQPGEPAFPGGLGSSSAGVSAEPGTWLSEEDLAAFGASATPGGVGALGFDPSAAGGYRQPGMGESSEDGASPAFAARLSTSADVATSPRQRRRLDLPVGSSYGTSPGGASGTSGTSPSAAGGGGVGGQGYANPDRKQMAYAFTLPPVGVVPPRSSAQTSAPVLSPGAIGHTGTSSYLLSGSPGASGGAGAGAGEADEREDRKGGSARARATQSPSEPLTELADVVGQLSLNENAEVRYHGRCVDSLSRLERRRRQRGSS